MPEYPKIGHAPIPMRRVGPDFTDELEAAIPWTDLGGGARGKRYHDHHTWPAAPGEFFWDLRDGERAIMLALPNDAGAYSVTSWPITYALRNGAQWGWDGNEDTPTLTPSLAAPGLWHGWVRGGQLIEA